jgi:hypothetical protein
LATPSLPNAVPKSRCACASAVTLSTNSRESGPRVAAPAGICAAPPGPNSTSAKLLASARAIVSYWPWAISAAPSPAAISSASEPSFHAIVE